MSKKKEDGVREAMPITEEHKAVAGPLIDAYRNLGLMSGFYNDEEVVFVCRFDEKEESDDVLITPLFIVLTSEMHNRCLNCVGQKPEGVDEDEVKKYRVKILWGSNPELDEREPIEYEFATTGELAAFLHGVDEGNGWLEYDLVEEKVIDEEEPTDG